MDDPIVSFIRPCPTMRLADIVDWRGPTTKMMRTRMNTHVIDEESRGGASDRKNVLRK